MAANTHGLTELGYTILLDRYAQKDKDRNNIAVGDIVVAIIRGSGKDTYQRREIARVSRLFESNSRKYAEILLLFSQETIELPLDHLDKPLELTPEQVQKRVAKGAASIEDESIRQKIQSDFEWALSDFKFIPGGRILAAAGTDQELTYMNCFVIPSPHDSRGGIMKSLTQMTEIMSRGGGVGMNLSSLRPNRAYVKGVNGRSSGSVSWGSLFSYVTGLIEQGGCFAGDTRVPTDKGLLRIDEIVKRHKNGERFYTKTHTGWKKITDVFENGVQPLIEIELRRGYTVRVTPNHPMAYLDNGEIAFIPAEEVSLSDQLLTLIPKYAEMNTNYVKLEPLEDEGFGNTALEHPLPEELDEDLAYLLGYSYGDGYVFYKNDTARYLSFSLATDYPQIKDRLIAISKDLFDYDMCVETCSGNWENAKIFSVKIMEWLKKNGILKQKSENIRVPEVIFKSPMSVQASFIAGYFDADGSITKTKKMIRFHSVNRDMLSDIQIMLASFGILSNMKVEDRSKLGWQDIRNLGVTGTKFKQRFIDLIPSEKVKLLGKKVVGKRDMYNSYSSEIISGLERKHTKGIYDGVSTSISFNQVQKIQERLINGTKSPDKNVLVISHLSNLSNLMPDTVVSIRGVSKEESYDITVEDEHVLSGNGIFSHNSRRGAKMLIIDDWHPDVFEFINSKREAGKITNANISVNFSDAFMEALKNDGDWELKFPDTSDPDYDTLWDGRLDKWIEAGKPVNVYQVVKAKKVWDAVIESAWASAEPGIWFGDRANKESNSYYYEDGHLVATNPCVTGDTLIYTDNGLIRADELYESQKEISVVVDGRFSETSSTFKSTPVFKTGIKQTYLLQTKEGYSIRTTGDHRFMTPDGWVELKNLKPGDKVNVLNRKGGFGKLGTFEDGELSARKLVYAHNSISMPEGALAGSVDQTDYEELNMVLSSGDEREILSGSEAMQNGFIQYLFALLRRSDFDNELVFNEDEQSIRDLAQKILLNHGIFSWAKGTNLKFDTHKRIEFVATVESITTDEIETVYDLTEPITHSFIGNGFVIHNCAEQPLSKFSSCNLGSINLSKMYDSHTKWIDFDKLYKTATIATRFLDNILSITPYPLPENKITQHSERRVGLGTTGIAELLIKIGIRYGSDEGDRVTEEIFKTIAIAAYSESARLAKEKGAFPRYSDDMMSRPFMRKIMDVAPMMDDDGEKITFEEYVSRYGMRNVTLITQAPVGSTGSMVNTSTGIEPFFSWKFYRKGRLGIFEENAKVVQDWLNENPDKTIDDLPFYFVTAMDLTPEEHVKILATAQKWNDSSISKTCNVPNEYTVEEVGELYRLMYDLGAKGGTIYRDGSRDEQVLNLTKEQAEKGNQKKDEVKSESVVSQTESVVEQPEPVLVPTPHGKVSRPKILSGKTFMKQTDWGTFFVTVNELENGDPYEVFVTIGKSGSDVQAFCEAMGRLISLALRYGNGNRRQILAKAVEQIRDIGGGQPSGFGPNKIFSIPDAVAKIIEDYYINGQNALEGIEIKIHETKPEVENMPAPIKVKRSPKRDVCPECGNMTLVREEGCYKCQSCGYSKC